MSKPDPQRQTAALVEAGMALASELDLDALLQRIADLARDVVGARYAAVGTLRENGSLDRFVYSGIDEETARLIGPLPRGRGLLGVLIEGGRPLRLREMSDHPRSYGFPPGHPPMHSFLGVPIVVRGRVFGRLYLTEKAGAPEFSKDDERIALTLASQAGVALENARLIEEVRARGDELAVLEERDRISKELHDGVIQSIYSVGLSLQGALGMMKADPTRATDRIEEAITELDKVVRDVRSYIFALQPKEVEEKGLRAAIEELVKDLEVNTLAEVDIRIEDAALEGLAETHEADVIQIVREVLANIARHAQATSVTVRGRRLRGGIEIEFSDDGVGFDPAAVRRGHGLNNIAQRAARMGGTFEMEEREPRGTIQVLRVPAGGTA